MARSIPRFPKGIGTYPPRAVLSTAPSGSQNPWQAMSFDDFAPYTSANYTVGGTGAAVTQFPFVGGAAQLTAGAVITNAVWLASNALSWQVIPGDGLWLSARVAHRSNSFDTNFYCGLFDNQIPTSATNGIYFIKPSTGSTLNFVNNKGGTVTTFSNVGDMNRPSGLTSTYDPFAVTGTLAGTIAGNVITAVSVANAGAGYMMEPIVINTTAAGSGGTVIVTMGSSSYGTSSAAPNSFLQAMQSTGIQYGSLFGPVITAVGSAYTNGAASFEVDPWIDLQFYWDGLGRLTVGINGRFVMAIGGTAVEVSSLTMTPGQTYNMSTQFAGTGTYFNCLGTQLSTSVSPAQPALGSFYNVSPLVPMYFVAGFANSTANARFAYISNWRIMVETN